MANTLTAVTPKLLAQGLMALRQHAIMPQLVNRQYETMAGQRGSTIDVPIPSAITAVAVSADRIPPTTLDVSPTSIAVPMDQWYEAPFYLDDKDMLTAMEGTIPMQASEAIKAIANNVDSYLLNLTKKFYGYYGTAGTTPFGDEKTTDAAGVRTILNKQLAPMTDRRAVLDPDAEGEALGVRAFQDVSWSQDSRVIREGNLQEKLGMSWWMDQNVVTHTAGSLTGTITVSGTHALGDKTILLATGAGEAINLLEGDIVTFAGHTQTYVVTADLTVGASATGTLNIEPGLQLALAGGEAVTVKATHVINPVFHRDAIAFATRPLAMHGSELGVISQSAVDPISGLALRLEITHEHKRIRFSYDVLYGGEVVRRELGARLAG